MTDDEIRDALLSARGFAPYPVIDHIVVLRERVTGDLDEIDRWVQEHGGHINTEPGSESSALTGGLWQRPPSTEPSRWYVVPGPAVGL